MKYLLDTNACIALLKRRSPLVENIERRPAADFRISSITLAELEHGVANSKERARNRRLLGQLTREIRVELFGAEAAREYGAARRALEVNGALIGPMDLLIASHCLALGLTLITDNEREFRRVPSLRIENWLRPSGGASPR